MKKFSRKNAVWLILSLLALIAVVAGFLIPAEEEGHEFWWSPLPVFFALMGFLGCMAIVFTAKLLGHYLLQRKEDYYD